MKWLASLTVFSVCAMGLGKGDVAFEQINRIDRPGTSNGTWVEVLAIDGVVTGKGPVVVRFLSRKPKNADVSPILLQHIQACQQMAEIALVNHNLKLRVTDRLSDASASPTDIVIDSPKIPGQGLGELAFSCSLSH